MRRFSANSEDGIPMLNFATQMTWVISPTGLGEKAHPEPICQPSPCSGATFYQRQVLWLQTLASAVPKHNGLVGKGEGRAKASGRGLRKVPFASKNRKAVAGIRRIVGTAALPFVVVILIISAFPAFAATHPVPLEMNTDSAKCLECHEDKAKGKAVHSAVQMGCLSCHEVRVNKEVTRVKLITTTTYALCLTCHADKNATEIKGLVHTPAVRDCVKCHDPHVSENKNQLRKASAGGEKENLCLSCHQIGLNTPEKGSRHAALDMGCETCHVTHKTGERGKQEFDYHLTKSSPALCVSCHDPKDANLQKAHSNQPFGASNCIQCHDPHQSKFPKLLQAFTHNPFENKMCESCHKPAADGKVVLAAASAKDLCVTCHDDKVKQISDAKVQHPGAAGSCTDCHDPHAGKTPGFIKPDPVNACLGCHADQAEQHKKKNIHQPAFEQGCATCHEPHGGDNEHLLRTKTANALCLECHGPERSPNKLEAEHLVTIFGGKVKLPESYLGKVAVLPLKYGRGHPTTHHPVVDQMDPTDTTKVRIAINCLTCHQPHASTQPGLLAKDQANNTAFCDGCHKSFAK
jgi:predicted CXXCH cytochrome family protein